MSNITLSKPSQSKPSHSKRYEDRAVTNYPHDVVRASAHKQNCTDSAARKASSVLLRDDHLVLLAIDGLLALYASFKRWRKRRQTLRALGKLDERQLRDIGLTRGDISTASWWRSRENCYRALAELGDGQLSNLSEVGLQFRREARAQLRKICK